MADGTKYPRQLEDLVFAHLMAVSRLGRERGSSEPALGRRALAPALEGALGADLQRFEPICRRHFRTAFAQAIAQLSPERKALLRCHYLVPMRLSKMAERLGLHPCTLGRLVIDARSELLAYTQEHLCQLLVNLPAEDGATSVGCQAPTAQVSG